MNQFVRTFVQCVDEAGSYVHQTNIRLRPPKKVPTPYGGRLVYTLPGKTKMFVHLKVMKCDDVRISGGGTGTRNPYMLTC